MTIAVTGATGTVGRHVLTELAGSGLGVRALTREPARAPGRTSRDGVAWTRFSYTEPATWDGAFEGARALFVVRPPELVAVRRELLPALAYARDAGVERVVFLSVLGAERNPLLPHHRVEQWLESSGTTTTSLRAGNFMQNFAGVHAADIREHDRIVVPAGGAAMSYVDARDVAAAVARCLLDEAPRRSAWDVTGPAAITHDDVAAAFTDALGRPVRYTRPSLPRYWAHARRTGMDVGLIAATSVLYTLARCGIGARVGADTEVVVGRPARTIATFVRDHRATWERR